MILSLYKKSLHIVFYNSVFVKNNNAYERLGDIFISRDIIKWNLPEQILVRLSSDSTKHSINILIKNVNVFNYTILESNGLWLHIEYCINRYSSNYDKKKCFWNIYKVYTWKYMINCFIFYYWLIQSNFWMGVSYYFFCVCTKFD